MLFLLREKENDAINEIKFIFNNFREDKLMDEFYKLEIIKFSKSYKVTEALLKSLKLNKRNVKRPVLLKKIDKIIGFLKS